MTDLNIRPVCFSRRMRVPAFDPSSVPDSVHTPWDLPDHCLEAFARLLPLLACGEESAIHVFSNAADHEQATQTQGRATLSVSAQVLTNIATDEIRHEAWLAAWRARLPDCLDLATRRQARRFFSSLSSDDHAIRFIRIAALDSAVCQILAPLLANDAPLSGVAEIRTTLNRIRADEARHVRISRAGAIAWGASSEQIHAEWHSARRQLACLLESVGADLAILGADPDTLFRRLKHIPQFPAIRHS